MFQNKTILITGGTGSWGYELVKQLLLKDPKEIRIYSRNEFSQVEMQRKFDNKRLNFIIGDIKEKDELTRACAGVDYIFHLAALKHVPVCEAQPLEALKTNVMGTQNVIDAAIANHVKTVVYISTDKAANPSNFYGMTKSIGEKLIIHANTLHLNTKFVCVRGGNVLGTNGSVIHVFKDQIKEKNQVGITDYNMTRFFLTLEDAINLLFKATYESKGGEIFVMKMPTCKIVDLAHVLIESMGKKDVQMVQLGIRPGEKIHEILFSEFESQNTVYYDEDYYVILPTIGLPELQEHYSKYQKVHMNAYHSNQSLMTKEEIKTLLINGGFIE
ncbi:polysaccharide biosynthesis protein [Bacillus sp. BRMEA1]|uniref:polysaccharide biosynthesis protein n=1 Tax=Neobacillus endophyticus TaxID=2738405 RepID=UPI00156459BE|nr:polysaccharide biosynthesis protein [Neobacillus endophyticus]NRD76715.1 polysaccharide biosynthesis protein [Neobacillus endophyticus]